MSRNEFSRIRTAVVHVTIAAAWICLFGGAVARGAYRYSLDRFEITGNLPISGRDEFDNGIVSPWTVYDPTVTEAGGVVTLASPGTTEPLDAPGFSGRSEMTYFGASGFSGPYLVQEGRGDFQATARWVRAVPAPGQMFGMNLTCDSVPEDEVSIWLAHVEPGAAAFLSVSPGLNVLLMRSTSLEDIEAQAVKVEPDQITGDVLFELRFDDSDDTFTGVYSLDGGSTSQAPFTPVASRWPSGNLGRFYFGVESWQPASPALQGTWDVTLTSSLEGWGEEMTLETLPKTLYIYERPGGPDVPDLLVVFESDVSDTFEGFLRGNRFVLHKEDAEKFGDANVGHEIITGKVVQDGALLMGNGIGFDSNPDWGAMWSYQFVGRKVSADVPEEYARQWLLATDRPDQ